MKTIVLTNQKGGVAKTTTAYALAAGLHNKGFRVLIVDADPQGNLTYTAGNEENKRDTLYEVLKGNCTVFEALRNTHPLDEGSMSILSVGLQATAADMEFAGAVAREYKLKQALAQVAKDYDYCVIDTAPTLGLLTMNALTAADRVIIPLNLEVYSLQGMEQLSGFIENIKQYTNKDLRISGLLITKYNDRLNITQALKDNVQKAAEVMETRVYDTKIRESVAVKETQLLRSDLYREAPQANATQDYINFVDEFLRREG